MKAFWPRDHGGRDGGAHPGQRGVALRRLVDALAGALDRLAQHLAERALLQRRRGGEQLGLGLARHAHPRLDGLDGEPRGSTATGVTAHPVRHDEEPQVLVDEVGVLVVVALPTDIGLAAGGDRHGVSGRRLR